MTRVIDTQQEDRLVRENLGLVVSIAKRFNPANATELEEFIQVGSIGLFKAIREYDPSRAKLSTIAYKRISWSIMHYMKNQKRQSRIPTTELEEHVYMHPEQLWELLPDNLTGIEKEVVILKREGETFDSIGKLMGGYTGSWANRIFTGAIKKIQRANNVSTASSNNL